MLLAGARAVLPVATERLPARSPALLEGIETAMALPIRAAAHSMISANLSEADGFAVWPRGEVAAASGADWVRFLAAHGEIGTDEELRKFLDDLSIAAEIQHWREVRRTACARRSAPDRGASCISLIFPGC